MKKKKRRERVEGKVCKLMRTNLKKAVLKEINRRVILTNKCSMFLMS